MRAYTITVNGKAYDVQVAENDASAPAAAPRIQSVTPVAAPVAAPAAAPAPAPAAAPAPVSAGEGTVTAPMAGKILSLPIKAGDVVAAGQVLLTFEAMKMENEIMAPCAGTVSQVFVKLGEQFDAGAQLVQLG